MTGTMTHNILLTRFQGGKKLLPTYSGWGLEGPIPETSWAGRGGKNDSNVAPFLTTRLAAFTHLLSNVMQSKRFLSHLILTLSWCLKHKTRSRWEKFASSYNPFFRVVQSPFWLQLGSRETPYASHPETEVKCCLRRNKRRAAWAA